jgi:hypothetical protein
MRKIFGLTAFNLYILALVSFAISRICHFSAVIDYLFTAVGFCFLGLAFARYFRMRIKTP